MKELFVTTSKGEQYTVNAWNEDPEVVVLRIRNYGLHCRNQLRIPPAEITAIEIREVHTVKKEIAMNVNEIIVEHLVLAKYIVRRYTSRYPNKYEDFLDVAMITLVEKANDPRIKDMSATEQRRFLISHVRWAIHNSINEYKTVIRCPRDTTLKSPDVRSLAFQPKAQPVISLELQEILTMILKSDNEKRIVWYLIYGYNKREIARVLNLSSGRISHITNRLRKRFDELWCLETI